MRLLPLPAFDDNYVWTLLDDAGHALVIDPGDAAPVLRLADDGIVPVAVLITHHDSDHIDGLPALRTRWPALPVYAPDDDRIVLANRRVRDGDRIDIAAFGAFFEVFAVPGHTRTHIAWYGRVGGDGLLFCGDTLFSLGCGRLFEGTPAQMLASLDRLAALPDDTRVCCTHEYTLSNAAFATVVDPDNPALQARAREARELRARAAPTLPATLASERASNPFLRCDTAAVRDAIARRLGRAPHDRLETFTELRRWKDGFRG